MKKFKKKKKITSVFAFKKIKIVFCNELAKPFQFSIKK